MLLANEKELIGRLTSPLLQERAFRELISLYKERLYWHIRRMVLNHDDADDVLQNTFIKVFRNINGFKGESALYSWLYRIATNEALTFLNEKAKKRGLSADDLIADTAKNLQADVFFEGDEIQLKLQQAIARLPEKQRIVFNMRYYDELKYEDMATVLETSVGALKASYHHAVKKIEEFVTGH